MPQNTALINSVNIVFPNLIAAAPPNIKAKLGLAIVYSPIVIAIPNKLNNNIFNI